MSSEKLEEYIRKNLEKGFSREEIKETLLNSEYTEDEIKKAFSKIETRKEEYRFPKEHRYTVLGITILVAIGFIFYFLASAGFFNSGEPGKIQISCRSLQSSKLQQSCRICKKIEDADIYNSCIALVSNRSKGCEMINKGKEECYLRLALRSGDNKYCENVGSDVIIRKDGDIVREHIPFSTECHAFADNNPEKCGNQSSCYLHFALKRGELELCDNLEGISRNSLFLCRALVTKNESYCESLSGIPRKICFLKIVAAKEDSSLCEQTNLTSVEKEACRAVAERNQSDLVCSDETEIVCSAGTVYFKSDSICRRLSPDIQDECYKTMVMKRLDLIPEDLYCIDY